MAIITTWIEIRFVNLSMHLSISIYLCLFLYISISIYLQYLYIYYNHPLILRLYVSQSIFAYICQCIFIYLCEDCVDLITLIAQVSIYIVIYLDIHSFIHWYLLTILSSNYLHTSLINVYLYIHNNQYNSIKNTVKLSFYLLKYVDINAN